MTNEYISREAVLADIEQTIENSGCVNHEGEIIDCVRYATAADVVEVVHARVVDAQEYDDQRYNSDGELQDCYFVAGKCEECGNEMVLGWNYCPNCGAKMESDAEWNAANPKEEKSNDTQTV